MQLAFVLLKDSVAPDAPRLEASLRRVWPNTRANDDGTDHIAQFDVGGAANLFVAFMPAAVPDGEAEAAAERSISSFGTGWQLSPHRAHLLCTVTEDDSQSPFERLMRFTQLLRGVIEGVDGVVGVYWGGAGATHDPAFFRDVARESEMLPIMLWNGVSIAGDPARVSLLSLGMKQLGLPDLMLSAARAAANDALEFFFDLLSYMARRGEALPDGDTIGRSAEEKLHVRYEPSPLDDGERVCCIDLP